jgi:hypothetical protein
MKLAARIIGSRLRGKRKASTTRATLTDLPARVDLAIRLVLQHARHIGLQRWSQLRQRSSRGRAFRQGRETKPTTIRRSGLRSSAG